MKWRSTSCKFMRLNLLKNVLAGSLKLERQSEGSRSEFPVTWQPELKQLPRQREYLSTATRCDALSDARVTMDSRECGCETVHSRPSPPR